MMAEKAHWEFQTEEEMWQKIVGAEAETVSKSLIATHYILARPDGKHYGTVLEIGAGCGRLLKYAVNYADAAIGVDYAWCMVHAAVKHLRNHPRAAVVKNDGRILPFGNDKFDVVYSFLCFQHMPDLDTIEMNLREAKRVLKDNGRFVMQTVEGDRWQVGRYDGYVFESGTELALLLTQHGFRGVQVVKGFSELEWLWGTGYK
jgi:ubiquinone/menaquinone biosynthesis C-methylase UbiE